MPKARMDNSNLQDGSPKIGLLIKKAERLKIEIENLMIERGYSTDLSYAVDRMGDVIERLEDWHELND